MTKYFPLTITLIFLTLFSIGTIAANAKENLQTENYLIRAEQDKHFVQVNYPVFTGFSGAKELNTFIAKGLRADLCEIEELANVVNGEYPTALYNFYDYKKSGNFLSYWQITENYTGGAHGSSYISSLTVNTKTGQIYSFLDLFKDEKSFEQTIEQIIAQAKENKDLFDDALYNIAATKDYQYYLDGSNIIVYFTQYELGPYAIGIPSFILKAQDLKKYLKPDIYHDLINSLPLGEIRLNGSTLHFKHKILHNKDTTSCWMPVEETFKYLNLKLNKTVEIKDCQSIDNIMYVDVEYFRSAFTHINLTYDHNGIVKLFKADKVITPEEFLQNTFSL